MTSSSLFRVTQGAIHVNSISVYHRSDEAVVFEAYLAQKRAEVVGCSCNEVIVMPEGPVTSGELTAPTTIHVSLPNDGRGWTMFGEVSRYTLWICAVRCVERPEYDALGWSDEEAEEER